MSTQPSNPAPKTAAKSSIPLPVAIGLLVVALALLFFFVLKPMFFSSATPPPAVDAPGMMPGAPPGMPAPPGGPEGMPDAGAGAPPPPPGSPPPAAPAPPAGAPAPAEGAAALTAEPGEIIVTGTVTQVMAAKKRLVLDVTEIQLGGKPKAALAPSRSKEVVIAATTDLTKAGQKATMSAIAQGTALSAVGPNFGEGKPLVARAVALK